MKLLFIDDHAAIFDSLISVIKNKIPDTDVTVFSDSTKAFEHLQSGELYDLILLDLSMPIMNGYRLIDKLNQDGILIPIAVLSGTTDPKEINSLRDQGIVGFISKTSDTDQLIEAIASILSGNTYFPLDLYPLQSKTTESTQLLIAQEYDITPRQLQVLEKIADGMTNQQIAESLFLSIDTVKSHVKCLYAKLEVKSRIKCASKAKKYGLVT